MLDDNAPYTYEEGNTLLGCTGLVLAFAFGIMLYGVIIWLII